MGGGGGRALLEVGGLGGRRGGRGGLGFLDDDGGGC